MSEVALVRCESYELSEVKAAVQKGISLLGGAESFIKPGEQILLKPNWIMTVAPERCATTHPIVFRAVCEVLQEAGAELSYGDSPGGRTSEQEALEAARSTGFYEHADALGATLADFVNGREVQASTQEFLIAEGALSADGIVSLPKLKTHGFLKLTGAVKNQFGCIPGRRKSLYHRELERPADFARMLIELNMLLSPRLYIMDGIMGMEGNGPMNGDPVAMNVLLLSADPIALDATVCRIVGVNPEFSYTVTLGMQAGHGTYLESEITLLGDPLESFVKPDFNVNKLPISNVRGHGVFSFDNDAGVPKPYIVEDKCERCGDCIDACPLSPEALSWPAGDDDLPPEYDYSRCIRCFCCQELCPHGAIFIQEPVS